MTVASLAALALTLTAQPAPPAPPKLKDTVQAGRKWLAEQQRADGSWVGRADSQPTSTTAMAGLALLMEGSTLKTGTYAPQLRKAVEWMEKQAQQSGVIVSDHRTESTRPVPAHAHAVLFLACAYDVDDDSARRKRVRKLLERAVEYAGETQSPRGGWSLFPARGNAGFDDSSTTVMMLHALLTARRVGIDVERGVTDKAFGGIDTLLDTRLRVGGAGGVIRLSTDASLLISGRVTGALTDDNRKLLTLPRWAPYLKTDAIPLWPQRATATALTAYLQLAHARFLLGDGGHRALDPDVRAIDVLKWSEYRASAFPAIQAAQSPDGSWVNTLPGPVYGSAVALVILQLDNDYIAAFAR